MRRGGKNSEAVLASALALALALPVIGVVDDRLAFAIVEAVSKKQAPSALVPVLGVARADPILESVTTLVLLEGSAQLKTTTIVRGCAV